VGTARLGYGSAVDRSEGERGDHSDRHLMSREGERTWDDQAAAERVEVEWAATSWRALVAGSVGDWVDVTLTTGSTVAGRCVDHGRGWCLIDGGGRYTLVLLDQVVMISGVGRVDPERRVQRGAGAVLRRWARMRDQISVELVDGRRVEGRLSEVMSDAVCVVRETESARRVVIPLTAVVAMNGSAIAGE
jgi:hypothetical protein